MIRPLVAGIACAALALELAGCDHRDRYPDDAYQVCVDAHTHERLDDALCEDRGYGRDAILWYMVGRSLIVPPVGTIVVVGGPTRPAVSSSIMTRLPRTGVTPRTSTNVAAVRTASNTTRSVPPRPTPRGGSRR